ncbi:MAG: glycosyltransferase [Bacteroidia bacterium]
MLTAFFFLLAIFTLFYVLLVLSFIRGWTNLNTYRPVPGFDSTHFFTIVIAARNEEENIGRTLRHLLVQDYEAGPWEIIVVNDHSEDATAAVVKDLIAKKKDSAPELRLLQMQDDTAPQPAVAFKKRALEAGIAAAKGDWIITTDADTDRGSKWLSVLSAFIREKEPVMVSAPVAYHKEANLFERMQSLEFLSLIGIGAASLRNGTPNMCNGANLAFSLSAFRSVGGYRDNSHLASGDDEFLMHKLFNAFPGKVLFLKNRDATVFTRAAKSLREFVMQRKRWVSKSTFYSNRSITVILAAAYTYSLLLLVAGILCFFYPGWWPVFILIFFLKILSESAFLFLVTSFFNRKTLLILFLPAAILHILYVLFIGIYGNIGGYTWKGRKVK